MLHKSNLENGIHGNDLLIKLYTTVLKCISLGLKNVKTCKDKKWPNHGSASFSCCKIIVANKRKIFNHRPCSFSLLYCIQEYILLVMETVKNDDRYGENEQTHEKETYCHELYNTDAQIPSQ